MTDGRLGLLVGDEGRQRLAHLLRDAGTELLTLLRRDLGDAVGEGVDALGPLAAEEAQLVGVEGALRLAEQGGERPELVDLVAVLAHEVVDRPRGHRRLAQGTDRGREVLLAGRLRLGHQLGTQRGEASGRDGIQLLDGGAQVQDHPCILPQTCWCGPPRAGSLGA